MKRLVIVMLLSYVSLNVAGQKANLKLFGFCNDTVGFENKQLVVGSKKFYVDNFVVNPECDTIVEHYYLFSSSCGTECRETVIFDAQTYRIHKFYFVLEINYRTQKLLTRNTNDPRYFNIYNFDGQQADSVKILNSSYACLFCYIDLTTRGDTVDVVYKGSKEVKHISLK